MKKLLPLLCFIMCYTISQAQTIVTANTVVTNEHCFGTCGGSISVGPITGGTGPYTVKWYLSGTLLSTATLSSGGISTLSNRCPGAGYNLIVTDANNVSVTFPNTSSPDPGGGSWAIYRYEIHRDGFQVNSLRFRPGFPGIVNATCGCNGSISVDGLYGSALNSAMQYAYKYELYDIYMNLISGPTGFIAYNTNPSYRFQNLCAGSYIVKIIDSIGCSDMDTVTVGSSSLVVDTNVTDVTCNGANNGAVSLIASGGVTPYQYSTNGISFGSTSNFSNLAPGTYTFYVRDNGTPKCTLSVNVTIVQPTLLQLTGSYTPSTNQICNGTVDLTVTGGTSDYTYLWQPNSYTTQDLTNLCDGQYCVTVTDAHNCKDSLCVGVDSCTFVEVCCNGVPNTVPYWIGNYQLMCNSPIRVHNNMQTIGVGFSSNNWAANYSTTGVSSLQGPTPLNTTGTVELDINGVVRGTGYIATSDGRLKTNVKTIDNAIGIVNRLRGVTYNWDTANKIRNLDNTAQIGFIAQEVQNVLTPAVYKDDKGIYGLNYNAFIPVLVEAVKQLDDKISVLERENASLKSEIKRICDEGCLGFTNTTHNTEQNYLAQNEPNPTSQQTLISYNVSGFKNSAYVQVVALDGKVLSTYNIKSVGLGTYILNTSGFTAGSYVYSLFVDDKLVDSKKMIISKY